MFDGRPGRRAEVVLVGRSNVGKSTIMREITGHDMETGRKPGVTTAPNFWDWPEDDFLLTDLPGFGFMEGVPAEQRETIKTNVVQYIEAHADVIRAGILVIDANSAVEIIDRHRDRGEVPHDVDLFHFLRDVDVPAIVAVNKMDKVDDRDARLDAIGERLGLTPPWQQWQDTIAPIVAKEGRIAALNEAVSQQLRDQRQHQLLTYFT